MDFRYMTIKLYLWAETWPESEPESNTKEEQPDEQPQKQPTEQPIEQPIKHRRSRLRKTLVTDTSLLIVDVLPLVTDTSPPIKRRRSRLRKYPPTDILVHILEATFEDSHHKEINRLLKKGVFEPINA
jgi:hypothetical protein